MRRPKRKIRRYEKGKFVHRRLRYYSNGVPSPRIGTCRCTSKPENGKVVSKPSFLGALRCVRRALIAYVIKHGMLRSRLREQSQQVKISTVRLRRDEL